MRKFNLSKEKIFELRIAYNVELNRNAAYKFNVVILTGDRLEAKKC